MLDPKTVIPRILALLNQWGWEIPQHRLRQAVAGMPSADEQELLQFFATWQATERGSFDEAVRGFELFKETPGLAAWAAIGQAFTSLRQRQRAELLRRLDEAQEHAAADDKILHATIAHLRGADQHHHGDADQALTYLTRALELFGRDHFGSGRVLDTFGMVYASRDNFHAAQEFFRQAVQTKERFDDRAGLAVSYGNLGRLHLEWGYLDKAAQWFQQDLTLAQNQQDRQGEALMYNHLGQVALARAQRATATGRGAEARRCLEDADGWLRQSLEMARHHHWSRLEGYALKDQALVMLAGKRIDEAETLAGQAAHLFSAMPFAEGVAHVRRVQGLCQREHDQHDDAFRALRAALAHFESTQERGEIALTLLEIARTRRAAPGAPPLVAQEYVRALQAAEASRRAWLIERIEQELREVDEVSYWQHLYQRVRGRTLADETTSLVTGVAEPVTVLFLDLKDSTPFARGRDPEEVLMTINQMMADMANVLRHHQAIVTGYRGDGFMALFRGIHHPRRAVDAALELFAGLSRFNQPRQILGLQLFSARIGISTGAVCLGNVGTYDKMDWSGIGITTNLGARLEQGAEPGFPCISRQTFEEVQQRYTYRPNSPRTIDCKGIGPQQVWDVVDRRKNKEDGARFN